jgi:hypothetical protein
MMKARHTDYSLYEVPELEETQFEFAVLTRPRIEDTNDGGHMGDSISFAIDGGDEFSMFDV